MLLQYVKRGAFQTGLYTASSFIVRFFGFICMPWFVSRVSLHDFGIWDYYQLYFQLGIIALSSCSALSMTRFYFTYADDPIKQKQIIGNATFILLTITGVSVGFFLYADKSTFSLYAQITTLSICLFSLFSLFLAYLRVRQKVGVYFAVFAGQGISAILLTMFGVSKGYAINAYFYANCFSYFLFIPGFLYLVFRYFSFCPTLMKEQIYYGIPLVAHTLMYHSFFSVDRFIIKQTAGYELLGLYSLLWRFGTLFQFFAISLFDVWPIIMLTAQKEKKSDYLLKKLTTYCCIALLTGCIGLIVFTRCLLGYAFAYKYQCLIQYLPFYFLPMALLELARMFQGASVLSGKTRTIPLLSFTALAVQVGSIYMLQSYELWGVFAGNILAFSLYALLSGLYSSRLYHISIIDASRITKLLVLFLLYIGALQHICCSMHWPYCLLVFLSWPVALWQFTIIDEVEKNWVAKVMNDVVRKFRFITVFIFLNALENNVYPQIDNYVNQAELHTALRINNCSPNVPKTWLLSFPRSGNTWIRYCIEVLTLQPTFDMGREELNLPTILPLSLLFDNEIDTQKEPVFKAHFVHEMDLQRTFNTKDKLIVLVRNPKEVYVRERGVLPTKDDFNDAGKWRVLLLAHYFEIFDLYEQWNQEKRLLLYYEDIITNPYPELKKLVQFLNGDCKALDSFFANFSKHKQKAVALYDLHGGCKSSTTDTLFYSDKIDAQLLADFDALLAVLYPNFFNSYLKNQYAQ